MDTPLLPKAFGLKRYAFVKREEGIATAYAKLGVNLYFVTKGDEAIRKKKYEEALSMYAKVLDQYPKNPYLNLCYADTLARKGTLREADLFAQRAVKSIKDIIQEKEVLIPAIYIMAFNYAYQGLDNRAETLMKWIRRLEHIRQMPYLNKHHIVDSLIRSDPIIDKGSPMQELVNIDYWQRHLPDIPYELCTQDEMAKRLLKRPRGQYDPLWASPPNVNPNEVSTTSEEQSFMEEINLTDQYATSAPMLQQSSMAHAQETISDCNVPSVYTQHMSGTPTLNQYYETNV